MHMIQKAVIIPVTTALVLCIISFFAVKSTDSYLPIRQDTVFAYHDSLPQKADQANSVRENTWIGTAAFSDKKFDLVFENRYSNMDNAVSLLKSGNAIGEYGCSYIKTISSNAKTVSSSKTLEVKTVYGDFKYAFADKFVSDSEYNIISYSPRAKRSIVVFYQKAANAGLSSDYEAYVFEGVE